MMSVSNPTAHWGSRSSRLFLVILVTFLTIFSVTPVWASGQNTWVPSQTFSRQYCYSGSCVYNSTTVTVSVTADAALAYGMTSGSITLHATPADIGQSPSVDMAVSMQLFCKNNAQWGASTAFINSPNWSGTATIDTSICVGYNGFDRIEVAKGVGQVAESIYYPPGHPNYVAPVTAGPCGNQLSDSAVSLNGTSLTVRTKALSGYSKIGVIVPDGGDSTVTPTFNLTAANAVDGSPGYLFGTFTQSTAVTTARLVYYNTASTPAPVCYQSLTIGSGTLNSSGSSVGASDPDSVDGSISCGLNPFCYIKAALKWAFVPGASTFNQWQTLKDNASNKPPFSIIAGCISFVQGYMSIQDGSDAIELDGGGPHIPVGGGYYGGHDIQFAPMVWARDYAATSAWYNDAKTIASIFLYVCFSWWAFGYIQQNFGSKGETQ